MCPNLYPFSLVSLYISSLHIPKTPLINTCLISSNNIHIHIYKQQKAYMPPNMAARISPLHQPTTILPARSSRVSSFLPPHDATVPGRRQGKQQFMILVACRRIRGLRMGAGARPAVETEAEKGRMSKWEGEEWWEVEGEPASEEEERRLAEALEWLLEEAMQGGEGHGGREASDYNRRAHIFDRSSRVFPAIKARFGSPDAPPSSSSSS